MASEDRHDTVMALLPWHASHAVSEEERVIVESHLEDCPACRTELALLREVSAATRDYADEIPPVPDMLPRTLAAIDTYEQSRQRAPLPWLTELLQSIWNPSAPMARVAFAVQFGLILVFASLWLSSPPTQLDYTTLSGPDSAAQGARLTIVFTPETTEGILRQTVLDFNASIVSGPSALGVYVVALSLDPEDAEAVDRAIQQLRDRSTVIEFVERQP